ncbi:TIGR02281 family clan AA aspartic protease [Aliigemmobacter aestuarii]|uniref:TIGR02281 family clan AA aspartic protease n=1 Tax=Aliigemmobacter aestuarii TaxID=1445661 RepID=A0A4S3MMR2_9RHOB|nr:TIGR02281 family clan AA aspartic protease [Gemmobacter aestuarii]THD82971.1 TIGR02281 family clan AA aspartic protease [Gemmobacter aestuarii]
MDEFDIGRLAYLLILLVAVGGWVMVEYRGRIGFALRSAMAWGLIFLGVLAGYGLWSDISRTVMPMQQVRQDGSIEVPRGSDGHYHLTLTIDGTEIPFLVDTGATNVVLSQADARRLGIDPETLPYMGLAETANGTVRTAAVTLSDVALPPFHDPSLRAYVTDGQMDGSLLGMDYLGRFRIEIAGDRMILTR